MKKFIILTGILCLTATLVAQAPEKMSCQAILRTASGEVISETSVGLKVSILKDSETGITIYSETHTVTTNTGGLVSIIIGTGTTSDDFSAVDWSMGTFFLRLDIDPDGGEDYSITSVNQILTVPYALHAKTAESIKNISGIDTSATNELQQLSISNDTIYLSQGGSVVLPAVDSVGNFSGDYNDLVNKPEIKQINTNTAFGREALNIASMGANITAFGYGALSANTSAYVGTAVGAYALYSNTTGHANTAMGAFALYNNISGLYNTAMGFSSLKNNILGGHNVAIGNNSLYSNTDKSNLVAIGDSALYYNGKNATETHHGSKNTAIGSKALYANTIGSSNTSIGFNSLYSNSSGYGNTAIGSLTLFNNIEGRYNSATGSYALNSNTTGNQNTANGFQALGSNTTGFENTAIGFQALIQNTTGDNNTANGLYSLVFNITGSLNTAMGAYAGPAPGYDNLSNTVALGYNAQVTTSNSIRLGNNNITQIGGAVAWSNLSDGRFKTNVSENVPGLDFVLKLRPVTYNWDMKKLSDFQKTEYTESEKETKTYTGFIAQEVEKAANDAGYNFSGVIKPQNEQSQYRLSYAEFVVPLVKSVQEQQKLIEELIEENKQIKAELEKLK